MSDHDRLAAFLSDLGPRALPETPELSFVVATRLREGVRPGPIRRRRSPLVVVAASVVALAVVFSGVMVLSPAARDAVADFLGIPGIIVIYGGDPDVLHRTELSLGDESTLTAAQEQVDFTITYPSKLGEPDGVYVDDRSASVPIVSLVYNPQDGLPESGGTGVGMVITEFRASLDETFMKKMTLDSRVEAVSVAGYEGFWLSGEPHTVAFLGDNGEIVERSARLVEGHTLIWGASGVSYRMESELDEEGSIGLAESMTP